MSPPPPSRILLASCNSQHYEPVLWPAMQQRNASAFLWVGDAIYADDFYPKESFWEKWVVREATPAVLKALYSDLLDDPGYKALTSSVQSHNMTVLGAFDDHDYGRNNGDKFYRFKKESGLLYLDFLQKSSSSNKHVDLGIMEQRAAAGKGVYGVKVFDYRRPAGEELLSDREAGIEPITVVGSTSSHTKLSDRSVAIFILDCRTNKTPWTTGFPDKYFLNYKADFLGDEQWKWLEEALARSTAAVNVIVQGLQVHADRYVDGNLVEDWSRFPMSQHRLYQTILKSGVSAPILVSGDVHMAELLRKDCRRASELTTFEQESSTRSLLEVTTSGMTHSWGSNICARPQTSLNCRIPHFQRALATGMHWAHNNGVWTDVVDLKNRPPHEQGAKKGMQYALDRNFGEFEFDWDKRQLIVRIFGKELEASPLLSTAWDFDMLSGKTPFPEVGEIDTADFERVYKRLETHGAREDDWICVNYRGNPSLALKLFGIASPILLASFIAFLPMCLPVVVYFLCRRPTSKKKKVKLS